MLKWDFNKIAKELYWNHTLAWVFSCKFVAYFQNIISWEHLWRAAFTLANSYVSQKEGIFVLYSIVKGLLFLKRN